MYLPTAAQKAGTATGGFVGLFKLKFFSLSVIKAYLTLSFIKADYFDIAINAALGATVGFIVTSLLGLALKKIREKINERKSKRNS